MSPSQLNPLICDEGQVQCDRKGAGSKAMAACDAYWLAGNARKLV